MSTCTSPEPPLPPRPIVTVRPSFEKNASFAMPGCSAGVSAKETLRNRTGSREKLMAHGLNQLGGKSIRIGCYCGLN